MTIYSIGPALIIGLSDVVEYLFMPAVITQDRKNKIQARSVKVTPQMVGNLR